MNTTALNKAYGVFEKALAEELGVQPYLVGIIRGEYFQLPEDSRTRGLFIEHLQRLADNTAKTNRKARLQSTILFLKTCTEEQWAKAIVRIEHSHHLETILEAHRKDVIDEVMSVFSSLDNSWGDSLELLVGIAPEGTLKHDFLVQIKKIVLAFLPACRARLLEKLKAKDEEDSDTQGR